MSTQTSSQGEFIAKQIIEPLTTVGGLYLRGILDEDVVRSAEYSMRDFFSNKDIHPESMYDPHTRYGYTPPGVEGLQHDEAPNMLRALFDYHPLCLFAGDVDSLYWSVFDISQKVLAHIDMAFRTSVGAATSSRAGNILRIADYQLWDTTPEDMLFPAHRDFGLLTMFIGTNSAGLQIRAEQQWQDVQLAYGDVFVGVGTPLKQYCPQLKTLLHRVVGGATGRRMSMFMFIDPHDEVMLPSGERFAHYRERILKDVRKQ